MELYGLQQQLARQQMLLEKEQDQVWGVSAEGGGVVGCVCQWVCLWVGWAGV